MNTRLNPLGYPMIPDAIRRRLFGESANRDYPPVSVKVACESNLDRFDFKLPPDPKGIPEFPRPLELPPLRGNTLEEHFEVIAKEQLGSVEEWAKSFQQCELPPLPNKLELVLQPGWTRYSPLKGVSRVEHPLEKVFTFDTETFVQGGSYPIIGTAVSAEAVYLWLAPELLDPSLPPSKEWVPVGTGNLIIAHNAAYDRVRTAEAYSLETGLENYWLDTLSMHVGCCGLAAGQRWLHILSNKDPELLTEEEKARLRFRPQWLEKGCTNSLVECYNFHVYETKKWENPSGDHKRMELGDKAIRDVFVKASSMEEFQPLLVDLIWYALKDSWYTAELFQYLYPRYRDSTPTATALMGHFYLAASRVPVSKNWYEWVSNTEKVFQDHVAEMSGICRVLMNTQCEQWLLLFEEGFSRLGGKREATKALKREDWRVLLPELKAWVESNPWRCQLDWSPKFIGNVKSFPEWKGKVLPMWCHRLIMDESLDIGTKSRAAHLLLELKWQGSPLVYTEDKGWCFTNSKGELEKIPHPKRPGENVGGVLSKDFVKAAEIGVLSSELPEANRALEIANATSYWTSVRNRVFERYAPVVDNPYGEDGRLMLPSILPHGTLTRRVVEPLLATLCSTKAHRIGTELKTRIEAPEGWAIVGGDFDGQEMRIASAYADVWEGGLIGGSPLGYQVLSGSKELGTDSHTKITREAFPEYFEGVVFDPELGLVEEVT